MNAVAGLLVLLGLLLIGLAFSVYRRARADREAGTLAKNKALVRAVEIQAWRDHMAGERRKPDEHERGLLP